MDALILKQFLYGLSESIRVWVRRHQPNTLEAMVKLTEEYAETDFPRKEGHPDRKEDTGRKGRVPPTGKGPEKRETNRGVPTGT